MDLCGVSYEGGMMLCADTHTYIDTYIQANPLQTWIIIVMTFYKTRWHLFSIVYGLFEGRWWNLSTHDGLLVTAMSCSTHYVACESQECSPQYLRPLCQTQASLLMSSASWLDLEIALCVGYNPWLGLEMPWLAIRTEKGIGLRVHYRDVSVVHIEKLIRS